MEGGSLPDSYSKPELLRVDDIPVASALESLTRAIVAVVKECNENGTLAMRRIAYTLRPNFSLRSRLIRQS
jgi:hypothetical protein